MRGRGRGTTRPSAASEELLGRAPQQLIDVQPVLLMKYPVDDAIGWPVIAAGELVPHGLQQQSHLVIGRYGQGHAAIVPHRDRNCTQSGTLSTNGWLVHSADVNPPLTSRSRPSGAPRFPDRIHQDSGLESEG